ncbi:MAG TPA: carboxypeptidase-like regulatory domain-containing protein [Candidatus Aquilonibacter sp.]|nr:carboxypeptidase-like regulatory domain-containing protein [Candidatus Aquilonibacter sp.]
MRFRILSLSAGVLAAAAVPALHAQEHGRKWQPPPPTASVVVNVVRAFDGKPYENAGVVFHAVRNGKDDGNLEVKTDPDGNARIDVLEVGSHVLVQVIATGYATAATEFDLPADGKHLSIKLRRPQAQVSAFEDNDGKLSQTQPGTQERVIPKSPPSSTQPQ